MLSSRWHFRHSCKFQTGIVQPLHYHRPREASSPFWETSQWPYLALKDMRSLKRVWCLAVFTVCLVTCTQFERLPTCMMQWCKKDFFETVCVFEIGGVVILVDWLTCVCWKGNIILVLLVLVLVLNCTCQARRKTCYFCNTLLHSLAGPIDSIQLPILLIA